MVSFLAASVFILDSDRESAERCTSTIAKQLRLLGFVGDGCSDIGDKGAPEVVGKPCTVGTTLAAGAPSSTNSAVKSETDSGVVGFGDHAFQLPDKILGLRTVDYIRAVIERGTGRRRLTMSSAEHRRWPTSQQVGKSERL